MSSSINVNYSLNGMLQWYAIIAGASIISSSKYVCLVPISLCLVAFSSNDWRTNFAFTKTEKSFSSNI